MVVVVVGGGVVVVVEVAVAVVSSSSCSSMDDRMSEPIREQCMHIMMMIRKQSVSQSVDAPSL